MSAVQIFTKNNPPCSQFQISRFVNNTGTFSAKFKRYRSKMCGGFSHHFSAYILTAGEKDVIKMFFQQAGVFRTSTGDNCNHLRRKTFADHFLNQCTGMRRICTWFQNHGVSGSNRINKRIKREQERIVPRTHDQNNSIRPRFCETPGMKLCKWCVYPFLT